MNWILPWKTQSHFLSAGAFWTAVLGISFLSFPFSGLASGQSVVDFRRAVRTVEPSLYTVVVTTKNQAQPGNDDIADVQEQPEANEDDAEKDRPPRREGLGGARIEMFDMQGRPLNRQGIRAPAAAIWADQWPQGLGQRANAAKVSDIFTTGFAIDETKLIAYLGQLVESVNVEGADGKSSEGKVLSYDYVTGLAAIEVPNGLFASMVVSSSQPQPGLPVIASWLVDGRLRTDAGMISSRPVPSEYGIGMTPQIDFGGSSAAPGAPVVDADGIVVGVMIPGGGSQLAMASASHINRLMEASSQKDSSNLKRGLVGIQFEGGGPLVAEVADDSGASEAGIKAGDLVTKVANLDIKSASDVVAGVAEFRAGETVPFTIQRDGETVKIEVKLGEHPQQSIAQNGNLGLDNVVRRAFQLKDGKLVPMEVDPAAPMPQFPQWGQPGENAPQWDELLKPFQVPFPQAGQPWQRGPIEGFEVERSNVEDTLRQLQEQMEKLNKKLDQID